jgi:hypothetical protein
MHAIIRRKWRHFFNRELAMPEGVGVDGEPGGRDGVCSDILHQTGADR